MATLDQIQARLSAEISRAIEARMRSTGPGPDAESAATLAAEIEARLMQFAEAAEADEVRATCTGLLQDEETMPTLTDEIKTFIVKGLACYDTPSQVAEAVKVHFNVEITRQHVYAYDPNATQHMSPRWRDLHAATRQTFLRETAEIGIAHRAVRLRRLDRMASRCERNSVRTALKCLEMAAKECGGMYENRKPIVLQPAMAQSALPEPPAPQPPLAAAPQPVMQQPSLPERPTPQAVAPKAPAPQPEPTPPEPTPLEPIPPAHLTPSLSVPLPVTPQPNRPASAAPQPLAVPAPTPQGPALPASPPLNRVDRYLAYVRDRHARDRQAREGAAAQAALDRAGISNTPPVS